MTTTVIEMVTYKLLPGATMEQLATTHEKLNEFVLAQDGFYYRSLSQDKDGTLIDLCFWRDMEAAKAASDAFMASDLCKLFDGICDMDGVVVQHMPVLTEAMISNCEETAA